MIVRILGEGQFLMPDDAITRLNELDTALEASLADEEEFVAARDALLAAVRELGEPLDPEVLEESDVVLPASDAQAHEVAALLTEEGLIPD